MFCEINLRFFKFESTITRVECISTPTTSVLKTIPTKMCYPSKHKAQKLDIKIKIKPKLKQNIEFNIKPFYCMFSKFLNKESLSIRINSKITHIEKQQP